MTHRFKNNLALSLFISGALFCGACGSSTEIASDPAHKIEVLSGASADGCYTELSVKIGGDQLPLTGQNVENPAFAPQIFFSGDAQKLFLLLTENEGSGMYLSSPHIFDLSQDEPTELACEDAVSFLGKNLYSSVSQDGIVTLTLPEQTLRYDVSSIESPETLFDTLSYEGNVRYFAENDTLFCDLAIQFSPTGSLGTVRLEYEPARDGYQVRTMTFEAAEEMAGCEVSPSHSAIVHPRHDPQKNPDLLLQPLPISGQLPDIP